MATYTPAMQQYIDCKKQHQDCILFFRIGDFYETFFEDAKIISKTLDLILTSKNKSAENPIPMAGIPHHSVDKYIQKLIQYGYKIAIAEQTTKPIPGQIVEREVVSIITPGTYIQENQNKFNYMLAISKHVHKNGDIFHIARGDFSLGEYWTKSFTDIINMQNFIISISPIEIIFDIDIAEKNDIIATIKKHLNCLISISDIPVDPQRYIGQECQIQSIESFGKALSGGRLYAGALLFHYIKNTQKTHLTNISKIGLHSLEDKVLLDDITIKNLEIFNSSYEAQEKYSLIGILDNMTTAGGSRLLRYILSNPINNYQGLQSRLDHIQYYQEHENISKEINNTLKKINDIPKTLSNILYRKLSASIFLKLRNTLDIFYLGTTQSNKILDELSRLGLSTKAKEQVAMIRDHLSSLLKDNDFSDEINFIKEGFDKEIDVLRETAYNSDQLLLNYQQDLIKKTGINNIKIKFIKNQGYFIEITNKDIEKFELSIGEEVARRSTLKGAQRYISKHLDIIEQKIITAKEKLIFKEMQLLEDTKDIITQRHKEIYEFAKEVSYLDLFTSHSILATEKQFCRPEIHQNYDINIQRGRHSVIEKYLPIDENFIPNNLHMDENSHTHIITGPNMGGKSTFLRQNALIVLMTHAGLYVPAKSAKIPLVDGIFARVGSGDQIAKNQSTFMTEMIEVANILNNATQKSFVVFDELGRGTATYDGLALSRAILEHVSQKILCKTLIATHYHELIQLEGQINGIKNYSVNVYETDKDVVFMKKIIPGGANKSYGLDVARLAGINTDIVNNAEEYLSHLETQKSGNLQFQNSSLFKTQNQNNINNNNANYNKIKTLLESFDLNNMTPLQALQLLAKLKDEIK